MKKVVLWVWILFIFIPLNAEIFFPLVSPGTRDYVTLRVEFQTDNHWVTTGDGRFLTTEWTGHDTSYVLDPLPHDRAYFRAHLTFIDHYWNSVSGGRIRISQDDSLLLPLGGESYVLSQPMRYYANPDSLDQRLAGLVYESVKAAVDSGEFQADNDGVIIYHAGVGQDFNIDLDDSPFDIPSFYFDDDYLSTYLPAEKYAFLTANGCRRGVVLPEMQNQLKINIALNGTEILLTGMLLGLPPLYDTETGRSGAGIFGLMDQGSNNTGGLCPVKPSAFERCLLGASLPVEITSSRSLRLLPDEVYRLSVSSNEYFLIEFRKNTGIWADSLNWSRADINDPLAMLQALDSMGLVQYTRTNGVVTGISNYDLSLPASGILIWRIVEPDVMGGNPNGADVPMVNLVEADGGDDIGKYYGTFDPSVNNGWKWDMWFKDNPGFNDNNPASYKLQFNDTTHPDTRSVSGRPSGIAIRDFKFYADSAVIQLVIDPPADRIFSGLVFDEMSTALPPASSLSEALIGYRDSSLFLYNGSGLVEIYRHADAYEKGRTALITFENDLLQVVNGDDGARFSRLSYSGPGLALTESAYGNTTHSIDLSHISLWNDSLFLPPAETGNPAFILDIGTWSLSELDTASFPFIPFVIDEEWGYVNAPAAAVMNNMLTVGYEYGFRPALTISHFIDDLPEIPLRAEEHQFSDMVPIHLNDDGVFEFLALTAFNGRPTLSAFTQRGYLLDGFPVFKNYRELRVYYLDGEPRILAYDPAGVIDVYEKNAMRAFSLPAPVNAASLFMEQVSADTAWLVADGCIYQLPSDSVYWGYRGKDAVHRNAQHALQPAVTVVSETLIRNALIYNYPNPAEHGITKFRYFATGAESVSIDIYQLSGRHAETLTQAPVDLQWNEVVWRTDRFESGVYIAKVTVSDGIKTETYFVKPAILK